MPNKNLTHQEMFQANKVAPGQKPCKRSGGFQIDIKNAETVQVRNPITGWSSNLSQSYEVGVNDIASFTY